MKDAYTFDVDSRGLDKAFLDQRDAYIKIFTRCGIQFSIVEASSGSMGGFGIETNSWRELMPART
jgi:prolyl-tRNA synthetase